MSRSFHLVDVFGNSGFDGNPVAVVSAAEDLDTQSMQQITRWMNLSETTFLLPPTDPSADYRVRIFTLARELPFAGHPTLGTCHVWLAMGGYPKTPGLIRQECGSGLIPIRQQDSMLSFAAPPLLRSGTADPATLNDLIDILQIDSSKVVEARWIDNGPGWVGLLLDSAETVRAVTPRRAQDRTVDIGLIGPCPPGSDTAFELRALFTDANGVLIEDPVTGSLNASAAQWMFETGRVSGSSYLASQGTCLGRRGRIAVHQDSEGTVWVGGQTRTQMSGLRH